NRRYNYFVDGSNDLLNVGSDGDAACTTAPTSSGVQTNSPKPAFTAGAAANIDSDAVCDWWTIDDLNDLKNIVDHKDVDDD
ncbi:MAG: hypothetical protein HYZ27_02225, partial [Deltaproteobacteria bacterium]|nr:hypothetical protein [Deltaproteobacteria bacterium]